MIPSQATNLLPEPIIRRLWFGPDDSAYDMRYLVWSLALHVIKDPAYY